MGEHVIDLSQARSRLRELVQEAVRGEEVILTDGGEPVARIVPVDRAQGPREFGSARGLIHVADDFDAPLKAFRELDRRPTGSRGAQSSRRLRKVME